MSNAKQVLSEKLVDKLIPLIARIDKRFIPAEKEKRGDFIVNFISCAVEDKLDILSQELLDSLDLKECSSE